MPLKSESKTYKVRCIRQDPWGTYFLRNKIYTIVETPGRVAIYGSQHLDRLSMLGNWSKEGYEKFHKEKFQVVDEEKELVLDKFRKMWQKRRELEKWVNEFIEE